MLLRIAQATMEPPNLAIATHIDERPTVVIQVKTATQRGQQTSWPLGLNTQINARFDHEWCACCRRSCGVTCMPAAVSTRLAGKEAEA